MISPFVNLIRVEPPTLYLSGLLLTLDLHSKLGTLHPDDVPGLAAEQPEVVGLLQDKLTDVAAHSAGHQDLVVPKEGQLGRGVAAAAVRVRADQADGLTGAGRRVAELLAVVGEEEELRLGGRT